MRLVTDGSYSIGTYHLRYLKDTFRDIDVINNGIASELDPSIHDELVDASS